MNPRSLGTLFCLLVSSRAFSFAASVAIEGLDRLVYSKVFGRDLVLAFEGGRVAIVEGGSLKKDIPKLGGLVGFDYANVLGEANDDLIVVTRDNVYAMDIVGGKYELQFLFKNETMTSKYELSNTPRDVALFHKVPGRKAVATWFCEDGLYAFVGGRSVKVCDERMPALLNNLGAQLTMPGMDSISIGLPHVEVDDVFSDGHLQAAYISGNSLKIVSLEDGSSIKVNIGQYYGIFPGIVWGSAPFAFVDVNGDGKKDLVLFSFVSGDGQSSVNLKLVAYEFLFEGSRQIGRFSPLPRQEYTLLSTRIGNGVCTLKWLDGDDKLDLEVVTLDLFSAFSDLVIKRTFSFQYSAFICETKSGKFVAKSPIAFNRSIDSPSGATAQSDRGTSIEQVINKIDFASLINSLFSESRAPNGDAVVVEYNGVQRSFDAFSAPEFRKTATLKAPQFMRLTDSPMLAIGEKSIGVYVLRRDVLYYEEMTR